MKAFLTLRNFTVFSLSLFFCIVLFLLPLSAFGQLAKADTGVIYGSTGNADGGRLITIDKSSGDANVINATGLNNIPAIAITSMGSVFAVNSSSQLYKLSADSADSMYINTIDMFNIPAMAFDHQDELYGLATGFHFGNDDWNDYWYLIKIDTTTAQHELLFRVNYKLQSNWDGSWTGMSFNPADGNLYAGGIFGDIFLINPLTGQKEWLANVQNNYWLLDLTFENNGNLFVALQGEGSRLALFNNFDTAAVFIGGTGISDVTGLASRTLIKSGAQIGAFPTQMDFGLNGIGGQTSSPLTLWNIGTDNLEVESITMTAPFSIAGISWPLIIEPGNSVIIDVLFTPDEANNFSDNIIISTNDPDNQQIDIPIWGESAQAPPGILFGIDADEGLLLAIDPESGTSDTLAYVEEDNDIVDYVTEIEFRQDGTLFVARGDGYEELYKVNGLNYLTTFVGDHDDRGLPGMDFSSDGTLYAIHTEGPSDTSSLVIVNQENADLEYIGKTGYKRIRGISFAEDGTLYGVGPDWADTTDILTTIDLQTGVATKIGHTGFGKITALEFGPDSVLYGGLGDRLADSLDGGLIHIDPATGAGTFIGLTAADVLSGISFFPALTIPDPISGLSVDSDHLPAGLHLAQNYPNPFNPKTSIRFSLDSPAKVSLKIYNMAGQLVKTLFSEQLASGSHIYNWNAHELASGLYFYQLRVGAHAFTKKAILIK